MIGWKWSLSLPGTQLLLLLLLLPLLLRSILLLLQSL
jgi:hypothetical protein